MDEQDGHMMLVARAKALETIALKYMELYHFETATRFVSDDELKESLERQIEIRAPGCSHN